MTHQNPLRWIVALLLSLVLVACQSDGKSNSKSDPSEDTGTLSLNIHQPGTRLLAPDVSLDVDHYDITGVGPEGTNLSVTVDNSGNAAIDFLRFGTWNIMVEAVNANGYVFARGSQNVDINVGETTDATITVMMLEDVGSFELNIDWPQVEVQSPLLNGFLRADGVADIPLNFVNGAPTAGQETRVAIHTDEIPAGYYTLVVTVHDQGTGAQNHLAMGLAETVRILEGQTTSGSFSLTGTPGLGNFTQTILLDADEPIIVNFDIGTLPPASFAYDEDVQYTASVSVGSGDEDFGNITFVWYLNGELLSIADSYTFDSTASPQQSTANGRYLPGHYRVDVVAFNTDGSRAGSTSYEFDVTGNPTGISVPQTFGTVTGQVGSIVTIDGDQAFVPMLGAQVLVGGRTAMTDATGTYSVDLVPDGAQAVQIVSDGYLPAFRPVEVIDQQTTNVDQIILREAETFNMDANTGGSFSTADNTSTVTFASNSIVDENGNPYTGTVTINATAVDPQSDDFFEAFPGDFSGITEGGDVVDIISFGAIAVELEDDNGNPLNIADGQTAEIRITVNDPANAPPTLPLWYLDETTGMWTEEGSATLIGNEYVGTVTHFSWWNFDYQPAGVTDQYYATGTISGTVVDANGDPVANADVAIYSYAGLNWGQSVTSDASGNFSVSAYLARNQLDPYYAVQASNNGLSSEIVSVRINQASGQNITGVQLRLVAPAITLSAEGTVKNTLGTVIGPRQTLVNNGPLLRFGDAQSRADIRLFNDHANGLDITQIQIIDDANGVFSVSGANPTAPLGSTGRTRGQLNNGDAMRFTVIYNGTAGSHTAKLEVTSNDATNPVTVYELQAGTSLTTPVVESITLTRMNSYIGYMTRDTTGAIFSFNSATDPEAPIFEYSPDASRVYFGFDTSSLPSTIASINVARVYVSSQYHNGLNLYQGQQTNFLFTSAFDALNNTVLNDSLIQAGDINVTLNQAGRDVFFNAVTGTDNNVPLTLQGLSGGFSGFVDLNPFTVYLEYTR